MDAQLTAQRQQLDSFPCCCVIIRELDDPALRYEDPCRVLLDTPDAPFCSNCEERHAHDPNVIDGEVIVTARIKVQEGR